MNILNNPKSIPGFEKGIGQGDKFVFPQRDASGNLRLTTASHQNLIAYLAHQIILYELIEDKVMSSPSIHPDNVRQALNDARTLI